VEEVGASVGVSDSSTRHRGTDEAEASTQVKRNIQSRVPAAAEAAADFDNSDDVAAARDVDDAAEGNDDDANTRDAEAEGAQVLVEMGRPASWRPALELPSSSPCKNPCR
jgi:hypothetical protein